MCLQLSQAGHDQAIEGDNKRPWMVGTPSWVLKDLELLSREAYADE